MGRHTFCTRLCERETNLKIIQSIMGHKDIQTTMDIYAEATEEKKQETFENLGFDEVFGRSAVMELLELKGSGASKLLSNLV